MIVTKEKTERTEMFSPAKFLGESPHSSAWVCLPAMVSLVSPPFFVAVGQEIAFCGEDGGEGKRKKREGENKMDDEGFFSLSLSSPDGENNLATWYYIVVVARRSHKCCCSPRCNLGRLLSFCFFSGGKSFLPILQTSLVA